MENSTTNHDWILALDCKKHVKIYKLKQAGLGNKDIAAALNTNVGHVHNELKRYDEKPELKTAADAIVATA